MLLCLDADAVAADLATRGYGRERTIRLPDGPPLRPRRA